MRKCENRIGSQAQSRLSAYVYSSGDSTVKKKNLQLQWKTRSFYYFHQTGFCWHPKQTRIWFKLGYFHVMSLTLRTVIHQKPHLHWTNSKPTHCQKETALLKKKSVFEGKGNKYSMFSLPVNKSHEKKRNSTTCSSVLKVHTEDAAIKNKSFNFK